MKNYQRYHRNYFLPPVNEMKWAKKEYIDKAPIWCSVDLRDGNQALVVPMSLEEKLRFFTFLVSLGFKEIEIGFPAASETEFEFARALIEKNLIPDDVTVQVLTQARSHIIKRTFEALEGAKNAVVHMYNSTSFSQRQQVFRKSKEEVLKIAVDGAKLLNEMAKETKGNFRFEYSPESFTGTEPEYALQVCNAVLDIWQPNAEKKVIINLPVTVSMSLPHIYANQIEYMCDNLKYRENVIVSLHPHNDRGTGVADAELGILAGADRIEGTLFGNGERTGNVDIITLAMNLFSHGVDPKLNLENMPQIVEFYESVTRMHVHERHPYAGQLVFAAFSGSHQDAIAKGVKWHQENNITGWTVPYLPIDPKDVGREYETDVIRINSQSGKGGISYLMENNYGFDIPAKMREDFGYMVKDVSDKLHKELSSDEILDIFKENYINITTEFDINEVHYKQINGEIEASIIISNGKEIHAIGHGNGRLDAVSDALKKTINVEFNIDFYKEHSLEVGSKSKAVAYVGIKLPDGSAVWGAGVHTDIVNSSVSALVSAVNRSGIYKNRSK